MLARRIAPLTALAAALALPLSLTVAAPAAAATVNVDTWAELTAAVTVTNDTVVLTADIAAPSGGQLEVSPTTVITLDLNGFALSITDTGAGKAAVYVPLGATLIIDDSAGGGILNATGGGTGAADGGAGIGGQYLGEVGTVTINGGTINATGGMRGAGIGGGEGGNGGTVTVNDGTVNAIGGFEGAGIGGGYARAGGTLTVNGGTVTATGGIRSAGIGGGFVADGGAVALYGGTVIATGGTLAAGIGGGVLRDGGTLEIHGTPDAGNATTGGSGGGIDPGLGAPITNPTMPAGVGYSAATSLIDPVEDSASGRIVVVFNYLVTFDAVGGSAPDDQTVDEGTTVSEPVDPTRTGFEFLGWQVGGEAYDFSTPVTEPVALTAAWTPVLAATGADQGLFLPAALTLLLLGGTLAMVARARRA